jgi:hypothetical protein
MKEIRPRSLDICIKDLQQVVVNVFRSFDKLRNHLVVAGDGDTWGDEAAMARCHGFQAVGPPLRHDAWRLKDVCAVDHRWEQRHLSMQHRKPYGM